MATTGAIPLKFRCRMCNRLAVNAFSVLCCGAAVCEECQPKLPETCPYCEHSPQITEPNESLRKSITTWLRAKKAKEERLLAQKLQAEAAATSVAAAAVATPQAVESSGIHPALPSAASEAGVFEQQAAAPSTSGYAPQVGASTDGLRAVSGHLVPDAVAAEAPISANEPALASNEASVSGTPQIGISSGTSAGSFAVTAPGVGADGVAISGEQAKGIDGSEQLSGDAKPLVMPGQQPLDMNDPSSYVPIMQAMQMGDFNMASQMMGMASGMNPTMMMNMFNTMNPMGSIGFQNPMFGGGFGGGGLGGLGMGPMMGSSGFNGYQVPFGAPPPFHPITGIPNFVGIGGTSNLPGNHVPPMFPPSNVNHQCHPNTDHAPYSARGGRDRGRGHYGFRGGRGAADFQGQGRYGQNGSYNYHHNFNYNNNQQAAAQPEHMKGFDTTPIRFENGQAPMVEIYDGSAAVISTGNKIESVRADEGGDGLGLGAEADASAEAAGEEVAADKTEGDDSESDADSLIIKLDGDAEDRIQGDNQSGWQGHPQADVQMPLHNDHRYPSFNRQSSFQSTNSSFPDHSGHYTGFQHPNGINDERIQTSNRGHNDSYREHGFANGHNVPIQPHAYAPVLAPPHFQSQHGRKSTINGSASAHTVPALRDNGPQTIPVRRAMGTGVEGAPKGPKAMRESAAVNPSLQINVHKTRLPYGAARGTRSTPEDQIEAGRAPRQESDYRDVRSGSISSPPHTARSQASSHNHRRHRSRSIDGEEDFRREKADRRRRRQEREDEADKRHDVDVDGSRSTSASRRERRKQRELDREKEKQRGRRGERDRDRDGEPSSHRRRHRHRSRSRSPSRDDISYVNGTNASLDDPPPSSRSDRTRPSRRSARKEEFDIDIDFDVGVDPEIDGDFDNPPLTADSSMAPPPFSARSTNDYHGRSSRHDNSHRTSNAGDTSLPRTPISASSEVNPHDLEREARNRERMAREEVRRYGRSSMPGTPISANVNMGDVDRDSRVKRDEQEGRRERDRDRNRNRDRGSKRDKDAGERSPDRDRERERDRDSRRRKRARPEDLASERGHSPTAPQLTDTSTMHSNYDNNRQHQQQHHQHQPQNQNPDPERLDEEARRREKRRKRFSESDELAAASARDQFLDNEKDKPGAGGEGEGAAGRERDGPKDGQRRRRKGLGDRIEGGSGSAAGTGGAGAGAGKRRGGVRYEDEIAVDGAADGGRSGGRRERRRR